MPRPRRWRSFVASTRCRFCGCFRRTRIVASAPVLVTTEGSPASRDCVWRSTSSYGYAIDAVGAGLATVLGNLQVLIVGFAAWLIFKERLDRRILIALPIVLTGVVFISGFIGTGAYGENPWLGVVFGALGSTAYAGFLLVLRHGSSDLRRVAGPLFDATVAAVIGSVAIGFAIGDLDLVPSWPSHGWLAILALGSQVIGWLLITISLPRLAAALTSMLLLLQPVGALALGALIYDEAPSFLQIAGVVLILSGVVFSASGRRPSKDAPTPEVAAD